MLHQPIDQQAQARRALGKVYALLYRLADEQQQQKSLDANFPNENSEVTSLQVTHLIKPLDQDEH